MVGKEMRKILLSIIFFNLMLISVFQSALSADAVYISQGRDNFIDGNYKDYRNCSITSKNGNVDRRACLFPGFWGSGPWSSSGPGVDVKKASGILIGYGTDFTSPIYFDDDHYYTNWQIAFVFSFTGSFSNYWDRPGVSVFEINGTAKFVRVYYL